MDSHLSHRGIDFVMELFVLEQVIMHQITLVTLESLVANLQQMTCKLLLPKTIKSSLLLLTLGLTASQKLIRQGKMAY